MIKNIILSILILSLVGCGANKQINQNKMYSIPKNTVIAHRGSTYWTPEETEPAYRWARNIGADYLELDLQLTKDNVLVAFHDNDLKRTTNIEEVFPDKKDLGIHDFTLKELRSLDVGSWYNTKNPDRAKDAYKGLTILTLQDVIKIAEGYRIKREKGKPTHEIVNDTWTGHYVFEKDPDDNGNRPGIYPETKHPKLNVEEILAKKLSSLGWNINTQPKNIAVSSNNVAIANTQNRVILQSFSPKSIENLDKYLPNIPKCFLLWKEDMPGDIKESYPKAVAFALKNNAEIIGPSIAGAPNDYDELTASWMTDLIHQSGLKIHAYTFDTKEQLEEYSSRVEAVFTNRADLALQYFGKNPKSAEAVLKELGY